MFTVKKEGKVYIEGVRKVSWDTGEMCELASADDIISDNFSEKAMQAIGDPSIRQAYADTILQIRDREQAAVAHMGHLFERYG